ncbi:MAG TPA: nuclear transport factor 2 family protein [Niabella sp.]|nr:nuclear transport factor 2 family protein [Niabella sp.]
MNKEKQIIKTIISGWARAVKERNIDNMLLNHSADIVMFDVPPPFEITGINDYRKTWEESFFTGTEPGIFEIDDLKIEAGANIAFCIAKMKCSVNNNGVYEDLNFRLTIGLKKIDGQWMIVHEHHSIPAA